MSQAAKAYTELSTYPCLNRRAVAEMQGKVVRRGKRSSFSRFVLAKGDKDKIAAWKQDLVRILHVFNVRLIGSTMRSRT